MKHDNKTAQQMADAYLKEMKSVTTMRCLTALVFLFLLLRLSTKLNFLFTVVIVAVLYFALLYLRGMENHQFVIVNEVLSNDCDAVKYTAIIEQILEERQKNVSLMTLCRIQGLHYSGRFQEALEALEQFYMERANDSTRLLFWNMVFSCRLALDDLDGARQAHQETSKVVGGMKAKERPVGVRTLHAMDASLALAEERFQDFYAQEEQVQAEAVTELQLVSSAFRMGKADLRTGKLESAREHLEDVVAEGNTFYMVEEAKALLAEMTPAELPDPTEA